MKGKHIGIVLILAGVVGFIVSNIKRDAKAVFEKSYTQIGRHSDSISLRAGSNYTIAFWVKDEIPANMAHWPEAEAAVRVHNRTDTIFSKRIVAYESVESGGIRRAHNYTDFRFEAEEDHTLFLSAELFKGDECELFVYKDMSEEQNILPGVFIIVLLTGFFVFMKYRRKETN